MTRANREKRKRIFWVSILIGLLVAGMMGTALYLLNATPRP